MRPSSDSSSTINALRFMMPSHRRRNLLADYCFTYARAGQVAGGNFRVTLPAWPKCPLPDWPGWKAWPHVRSTPKRMLRPRELALAHLMAILRDGIDNHRAHVRILLDEARLQVAE